MPGEFDLRQNYPNPFNPATTIRFNLPEASEVTLDVFNVLGQNVATLVEGALQAGRHRVHVDASHLTSGVYVYRLRAGDFMSTRKMVLVK